MKQKINSSKIQGQDTLTMSMLGHDNHDGTMARELFFEYIFIMEEK